MLNSNTVKCRISSPSFNSVAGHKLTMSITIWSTTPPPMCIIQMSFSGGIILFHLLKSKYKDKFMTSGISVEMLEVSLESLHRLQLSLLDLLVRLVFKLTLSNHCLRSNRKMILEMSATYSQLDWLLTSALIKLTKDCWKREPLLKKSLDIYNLVGSYYKQTVIDIDADINTN